MQLRAIKNMVAKVLFVTDRWCDGNPQTGPSILFHTIIGSCQNSQVAEVSCLHLDECIRMRQRHIEQELIEYLHSNEVTHICFSYLGDSSFNPSAKFIARLKEAICLARNIKLLHFWNDTVWDWSQRLIREVENHTDRNVVLDGNHEIDCQCPEKLFYGGTPHDERLFYPAPGEHIYAAGFIGSVENYPYRQECLNFVKDRQLHVTGGQREHKLSADEYARAIRSNMINVNFSESPSGKYQAKSRVFESTAAGTMLLESNNDLTKQYYVPFKEYIPFYSKEDLRYKIDHFSDREDECLSIAIAGHKRYLKDYSNKIFWSKVLA